MKKFIDTKYIPLYFIFFVIFSYIFLLIPHLFIKDPETTPYVIDAHFFKTWEFFKPEYILKAGATYDTCAYWKIYFPLDALFPVLYSLLFLSLVSLIKQLKPGDLKNEKNYTLLLAVHKIITSLIIAGAIFDYAENISFGIFLISKTDWLASVVGFCTSIKTILFIFNITSSGVIFLFFILWQ